MGENDFKPAERRRQEFLALAGQSVRFLISSLLVLLCSTLGVLFISAGVVAVVSALGILGMGGGSTGGRSEREIIRIGLQMIGIGSLLFIFTGLWFALSSRRFHLRDFKFDLQTLLLVVTELAISLGVVASLTKFISVSLDDAIGYAGICAAVFIMLHAVIRLFLRRRSSATVPEAAAPGDANSDCP